MKKYNSYNEALNAAKEFNREALKVLLNYKVVTPESIDRLVERNKIQIDDIEGILSNYR